MLKKANIFSIISSGKSSKEVEGIADIFRRFALVSIFSCPPEVAGKKMKYVRHFQSYQKIFDLFYLFSYLKSRKSNCPNWDSHNKQEKKPGRNPRSNRDLCKKGN